MNARGQILSCTPHAGCLLPIARLDEAVIKEALDEIAGRGISDTDDARVVAYAHYAGIGDNVPGDLYRRAGLQAILKRELAMHPPRTYLNPERAAGQLHHMTIMDVVRWSADLQIGWSFAVLSLVHDVDAVEIISLTPMNEDCALLLPIFAMTVFVPPKCLKTLLTRLVCHEDRFARACGIALAGGQLRESVFRDSSSRRAIRGLRSAEKNAALAALGAVLDDFGRWTESTTTNDTQGARIASIWKDLQTVGECLVKNAIDISRILDAAGRRQVQVLAFIAYWQVPDHEKEAIGKEIQRRVESIFDEQFASRLHYSEYDPIHDAYHPEWLTAPLIVALTARGLSAQRFVLAYNGLAADTFSEMTRFTTWLRDRKRAVVLIMISGYVAKNRNDIELAEAVREAAEHALSQPPLSEAVYQPGSAHDALGYPVPYS